MRVRGRRGGEVEEGPEALLAGALGRRERRVVLLLGPRRHRLAPLQPTSGHGSGQSRSRGRGRVLLPLERDELARAGGGVVGRQRKAVGGRRAGRKGWTWRRTRASPASPAGRRRISRRRRRPPPRPLAGTGARCSTGCRPAPAPPPPPGRRPDPPPPPPPHQTPSPPCSSSTTTLSLFCFLAAGRARTFVGAPQDLALGVRPRLTGGLIWLCSLLLDVIDLPPLLDRPPS